ncbi:phenylalanine--tRNA ligase subunit beta [Gulosibacter molinativorax]|uniref:Phenylalanine--tRNA ligase beta subunit n=1 Tax=Gulosibacter molinativorax TaxID=256821 RepID=A0ABT7C8N4_9MICO|nr:phenylalanine--tRNA ligase subunit beta [Gulosibacter molinativorax]MDJ1371576.1 phenylalanine--tRNA ligase subunit beta [Gulosibacter molinativorax]QUY61081.1 Phenylalanine--tRNA ligase beta subunit [Gulosibacter molinativorax]
MRAPISWLREYVDVPEDATPREVLDAFVRIGLEDEAIHAAGVSGPVVVGEVLERIPEPQSNGKTINWCQVRVAPEGEQLADGGADVRGIVCGAHNFEAGDFVVVALPGAELPGDFHISARKTYGHVSDGMIASERELGLGDDHAGIIVLGERGITAEPGTPALPLLGLNDVAVEVNVTPDRGYAMSMRGLAREYGHATGASFRDPALRQELADIAQGGVASDPAAVRVPVTIADESAVRGQQISEMFAGFVVTGVDPARATPSWMAQRLRLAGIRSLGLLIDITNYVMLELGQPIHGYDLDKLQGGIHVRRAAAGEKLTTLDGNERKLSDEDILITDDRGPIGLAGVMGGAETELSDTTTNVFIEAANFSSISIARTARRHKLPSEASRRFDRGVDPAVTVPAGARVAELLVSLAGGTLQPVGSVIGEVREREAISLPIGFPAQLMGIDYSRAEVLDSLEAVGCEIRGDRDADVLSVVPPTWRHDLTSEVTLVEEVGRLQGFDRIPAILPQSPEGHGFTREQTLRRQLSDVLAATGKVEVLSYPFLSDTENALFSSPDGSPVSQMKLQNAMDAKAAWMRRSMLPGLVGVAHRNESRGMTDLAIFELGRVFLPVAGVEYGVDELPPLAERPSDEKLAELNDGIPPQPYHLGALLIGDRTAKQPGVEAVDYGWEDAIELVQRVGLATAGDLRVRQGSHQAFHPGRCAEVYIVDAAGTESSVGFAGELHPAVTEERDLPRVVAAVELNVDLILEKSERHVSAGTIVGFPAATQDLSLVVPVSVAAGDVLAAVQSGAGSLLEAIYLVDDYRGRGLEDDQKSLTFALRFRATDRTLTAAEATEAKEAGAARAAELYGATIRA